MTVSSRASMDKERITLPSITSPAASAEQRQATDGPYPLVIGSLDERKELYRRFDLLVSSRDRNFWKLT